MADHYRRLGVTPSASTSEIRDAYRTLAGRLHPDRAVGGSRAERDLAERRMREINESWQVLRDPEQRRRYDESRRAPGTRSTRPPPPPGAASPPRSSVPSPVGSHSLSEDDDDLIDVTPEMGPLAAGLYRHLPWVALLAVLLVIFVATAYAGRDDPATEPTPPSFAAGTCLDVDPGPITTIVPCSGPHELEVVDEVPEGSACPRGTEPRRFDTSGLVACVR